jgi:outer membrane protein insertion porin family
MQSFGGFLSQLVKTTALVSVVGLAATAAYAQSIEVRGSRRVDAETIRNYFSGTDPARVNQAVKELYATGLFSSVRTERAGGRIIVSVVENNMINRVAFEGNSKLKSEVLASEVQSKSRGAYNPATVQADIERILDLYRRGGRSDATVTARTVDLPNGRIDVVFTVNEGSKTGVKSIEFQGNQAFSNYRLRNLMQTTEMNWLSFFKSTDVYDPDRIASDLELIRRFYLKNGYADFRIVGSDAHYEPSQKGYVITITVDEGRQYRVGSVTVDSTLPSVSKESLQRALKISAGDVYNGDLVDKSVESLTREVARAGYAFSSARPRGDRDPATGLINLSFVVEEGPRVYIERINIRGNTRTRDYVIRREFPIGEGDAYNRVLMDKAEKRLNNLGYFKKVRITNEPGSAPDRVVINVDVEDQPTGSFSISGGYSTTDGIIAEVSVSESNFMGRGQYARLAVTGGQRTRGVEFSFTEPYFLDYRLAAGVDLFTKQNKNNRYSLYDSWTTGATLRLGVPVTDELTFSPRYSIYTTKIEIPNNSDRPYNDCAVPIPGVTAGVGGTINPDGSTGVTPFYNCLTNGEASLAVREAQGRRLVSQVGYSFTYNTLDNNKNPTEGMYAEFRQDVAGLGGDAKFVRTTGELRYFYPIWDDIVGFVKLQGGHLQSFGGDTLRIVDNFNLGPSLVRGFAPGGIGPRDISTGQGNLSNGLGGTKYFGGSVEIQFPFFGVPKDLGLKGALFADAGTLFDYKGRTNFWDQFPGSGATATNCVAAPTQNLGGVAYTVGQGSCIALDDSKKIRSSVGASLLWQSPLGPIRFDYAFVLSKAKNDVGQAFRFSGGSSF